MRKLLYLIPAILAIVSCESYNLEQGRVKASQFGTRGIVVPSGNVSISNPALITDWETQDYIVLNTLGNGSAAVKVSSPWSKYGAPTTLPSEFCKNIKKEDGWIMLFHTFKEEGEDPSLNYMCFYNLFTGYLKFFYYNETVVPASTVQWFLKQDRTSTGVLSSIVEEPSMITQVGDPVVNEEGLRFNNEIDDPTKGLPVGWSGFQYQISRYEKVPDNLTLSLGAVSEIFTSFNFVGKFTSP